MAKKMKKKSVHWSKLPRTKLIGMVKRLELANAKLKTQLAEMRETKLLNTRSLAEAAAIPVVEKILNGNDFEHALSNPFMTADEAALAETFTAANVKGMLNSFDHDEAALAETFGVVHVKQLVTDGRGLIANVPENHHRMPWE